ncbi:MAG: hypothetical protein LUE90_06835 [Clostridiales bacterium]|nr:hypothetical protein [Clostridiales bacterium]
MEVLWNHLTRGKGQEFRPYFKFLLIHTLMWLLPLGIGAAVICRCLMMPTAEVIRYTALIAGYPALIAGFFGGVLYLMRNQ